MKKIITLVLACAVASALETKLEDTTAVPVFRINLDLPPKERWNEPTK